MERVYLSFYINKNTKTTRNLNKQMKVIDREKKSY